MHPSHLVDAETMCVIDLWSLWRGGQNPFGGGNGPLPFGGGAAEQPALLMDAFAFLETQADKIKPPAQG